MRRLISLFEKVVTVVRSLSAYMILLVGAVLIFGGVWLASISEEKTRIILITASGCIMGTGVISLIWPWCAAEWADQEGLDQRELLRKLTATEQEVARLMQTRVDVNSFKPVMKLGLLETDSVVRDSFRDEIFRQNGNPFTRSQVDEFVGVMTRAFKARLGMDLSKLRFWDAGSSAIMVSGMKSEFQGFMNLSKTWDLAEIRIRKYGGPLPDDYQVAEKDHRLVKHRDKQENDIERRMNNGLDFQHLDSLISRWAEDVLRVLLTPLGKEIIFIREGKGDGGNALGLSEYLASHNENVERRIREIRDKQGNSQG